MILPPMILPLVLAAQLRISAFGLQISLLRAMKHCAFGKYPFDNLPLAL
jgi:hypothetical protein